MKILLINDDSDEMMLWRTWIKLQQDIQIIGETATRQEADVLAAKNPPEIILLDFPVSDLYTLDNLATFRMAYPTTKFVISSALYIHKNNQGFVQQLFEIGIDKVIYHPYSLANLLNAIY